MFTSLALMEFIFSYLLACLFQVEPELMLYRWSAGGSGPEYALCFLQMERFDIWACCCRSLIWIHPLYWEWFLILSIYTYLWHLFCRYRRRPLSSGSIIINSLVGFLGCLSYIGTITGQGSSSWSAVFVSYALNFLHLFQLLFNDLARLRWISTQRDTIASISHDGDGRASSWCWARKEYQFASSIYVDQRCQLASSAWSFYSFSLLHSLWSCW